MKTNKLLVMIVLSMMMQVNAHGQLKAGIGQYTYTGMPLSEAIVPVGYIRSVNNWHVELRYNYEDAKTLSLFGGKNFAGGNKLEYDITPMAGLSTGRFTGISFGLNADIEWDNFFFSSQTQYSAAVKKRDSTTVKKSEENFFFTWTELGYTIGDYFFAGLSMQYTGQKDKNDFEPGFLAGFNFKNLSFPFYVCKPFHPNRYFILGINYEFSLKRKNKPKL